jgi:tetratricopeptide (TPR) repeat protein
MLQEERTACDMTCLHSPGGPGETSCGPKVIRGAGAEVGNCEQLLLECHSSAVRTSLQCVVRKPGGMGLTPSVAFDFQRRVRQTSENTPCIPQYRPHRLKVDNPNINPFRYRKPARWLPAVALALALIVAIAAIRIGSHTGQKKTPLAPIPGPIELTPAPTSAPAPTSTPKPAPTVTPISTPVPTAGGDPEAFFTSGYLSYAKQDYDESINEYTEAIRLKADYAEAYNNRGLAYDHNNQYDKAISDYSEAIRLDPKDARYYNNRGFAYDDNKKFDEAIGDYGNAILLDPNYTLAYINRGVSYFHAKQYNKAIDDYNQAIRLNPNHADAYFNRGLAYQSLGKSQKAKADFLKADRLRKSGQ